MIFDMQILLRCAAGAFLAVILILTLRDRSKEIALVLSVLTCCLIAFCAMELLRPVVDFLKRLQQFGAVNGEMTAILLKTVGIGLLGEICALVCKDSGNEALSKALQMVACAAVLYLSLPLYEALLDLLEGILGYT